MFLLNVVQMPFEQMKKAAQMSGFFCNFCAFRFCFENHISFLQSCAFGFAVIKFAINFRSAIFFLNFADYVIRDAVPVLVVCHSLVNCVPVYS